MEFSDGEEKWSMASLCIYSKEINAQDISKILKASPSYSRELGVPVSGRNIHSMLTEEACWFLDSVLMESDPLEEHIKSLLSFIEQHSESFQTLKKDCLIEIRCAFSSENGQGGFVMDSCLIKKLADISVDLVVMLYPPEGGL